jgi:hypothetical protein
MSRHPILTTERLLILILLIVLMSTAAYHKILGDFPPEWFVRKFEGTFFGAIPGGLTIAFGSIVLLEVAIPVVFFIALVKKQFVLNSEKKLNFLRVGFLLTLLLFVMLTFGSFLVQDYDNGFKDFLYFVGIYFLMKQFKE